MMPNSAPPSARSGAAEGGPSGPTNGAHDLAQHQAGATGVGAPLDTSCLRIAPLGGLGEIGMNCMVFEQCGVDGLERMLVDCGALFRDSDWGVDACGPRLDALLAAPNALQGVALTHGHEDHIGAVWTLARALGAARSLPLRIVGPEYAIALCQRRFDEYPSLKKYVSLEVNPIGGRFTLGSFSIESIALTHSTVDSSALAIDTAAGTVIHSGDFKLDDAPGIGAVSDSARLAQLGEAGVQLLMADSTNALASGSTRSEAVSAKALDRLIGAAQQRVIVGLFASNVARLDAAAAAARNHGRRLCLLGRSLRTHVEVSQQLGRLDWPSDLLVSPGRARSLPRSEVAFLATGTQGESRAALRRLANGDHHQLKLEAGDTVLMSCRIIPGQERAVVALTNDLERMGVEVIDRHRAPDIHVSGHARRDELSQLIGWVQPRAFVPLHGTAAHLHAHARLARDADVRQVREMRNGDTAVLSKDELTVFPGPDPTLVAYSAGRPLSSQTMRERKRVGRMGVLLVALNCGTPMSASIRAIGLDISPTELEALTALAHSCCESLAGGSAPEQLRLTLRRRLTDMLGYKPLVEVLTIGNPRLLQRG